MTIRYKRLWLMPAAVAVAVAGQSVTAQADHHEEKQAGDKGAKSAHTEKAHSDDQNADPLNQAAPNRDAKLKVQADRNKMSSQSVMQAGEAPKQFHAASQLIGRELINAQGEELGEVDEVVLDQSSNRVAYIVLSHGGWADIGDKLFAVPFDAIEWVSGDEPARFNVSKDRLQKAPGFDQNDWPDMADAQWSTEVDNYWQDETRRGSTLNQQTARASGELRWVSLLSELIGRDVDNQSDHLGEIEDIYIDDQGRLGFAAISYGGMLGMGDSTSVVPFNALTPRMSEDDFLLQASEAELKATGINDQLRPGLNQAAIARINKQYDAQPYWNASAQNEMRKQQTQMRDQLAQRSQRDSAQNRVTNDSWKAQSDYNKQFKSSDVKTYEGTIISVGQFEPGSDAAPGLRLRVRSQDNKTMTVHAGPKDFAQQKQVSFNPGDKVTIQGAQAQVDKRPVVLASQIRVKEQTLELRSSDGQPQWKMDQSNVQQAAPDRRTELQADEDQLDSSSDKTKLNSDSSAKSSDDMSAKRKQSLKEAIEEGQD